MEQVSPGALERAARFLGELKRRRVFRVLIVYAVGAWVLIQVVETTFPYLGLPDLAVTLVIVLAAGGLPVVLVLSWVFDITPEGLEITPGEASRSSGSTPTTRPPPVSSAAAPPVPTTPLVGREPELAEAERLIREEGVRLLTLVGPGGSGKTRLALELAHRLERTFRDGLAWVPLDSVRSPDLVPSEIGRAFGVGESGEAPLVARLASALRERKILLVLDNFEQVVDAADRVAKLLRSTRELQVLVTSRAPLRIRGERELPLAPLPPPDPSRPAAEIMASAAVRLFEARARDVNPRFEVTETNAAHVAAICKRLDGLPLALELAAARSKLLPPNAMLARLEERMPLLGPSGRDHPTHQRTLRDTIAWSHDLLRPDERVVFRRLGVFAGGSDLEAIQEVAGADLEADVLDLLQALVDQSLAVPTYRAGTEPRFTMLELIRDYALDALEASEESTRIRQRHAEYFTGLARTAEPELVGPGQTEWLDRLEREHDNLRSALDWLERQNAEAALELALLLWRFWETRGHLTEGRRRLDRLLAAIPEAEDHKLRLRALYASGVFADAQGDYTAARHHFGATLAMYRAAGDEWGVANALNNIGVVALRQEDYETAQRLYSESASLWRKLGNDAAVTLSLNNLGNAARILGEYGAARESLEESLAMQREAGDANGCALTLGLLAEVARDQGARDEAVRLYGQSLALFRETGNRLQIGRSLLELGQIQSEKGHRNDARDRYVEALEEFSELGSPRALAETLERLATLAGDEGDDTESARFAEAARQLRERGQAFDPEDVIDDALAWATATRPT